MRHLKRNKKLGRKGDHRNAMLANMVCSLIKHKRVVTTLAKARADGFEIATSREAFFEQCDVISLHLPANKDTYGIVTAQDLARMKPTAMIVNTSRAPIIGKGVLADALIKGRPGYAAVDVYDKANAARVVLVAWVVKSLLLRQIHSGHAQTDRPDAVPLPSQFRISDITRGDARGEVVP